jgi:hypothetical protein
LKVRFTRVLCIPGQKNTGAYFEKAKKQGIIYLRPLYIIDIYELQHAG